MSVQEEGAPTSGKEEAASVEEEAPSMSRNYVSVEEAEGRKSLKRKRASEDVACATAGKEDDGAGKAMVEHAPPATVYVALPPTCSLSHVFFLLFLLSSFFLKQAVALVGEFQRLQEAKAEIQRLQDVISEKTGEVSVLSLRLNQHCAMSLSSRRARYIPRRPSHNFGARARPPLALRRRQGSKLRPRRQWVPLTCTSCWTSNFSWG